MKFARYLEETQIPEWKRAYIDYRGLKKCIGRIRQETEREGMTPLLPISPVIDTRDVQTRSGISDLGEAPTLTPRVTFAPLGPDVRSVSSRSQQEGPQAQRNPTPSGSVPLHVLPNFGETITESPESIASSQQQQPTSASSDSKDNDRHEHSAPQSPTQFAHLPPLPHINQKTSNRSGPSTPNILRSATLNMGFLPRLRRRNTARSFWEPSRRASKALQWDLAKSIPLKDLMPLLTPEQRVFFEMLDRELDKIELFYEAREKEMRTRTEQLRVQLEELKNRGSALQNTSERPASWLPALVRRRPPIVQPITDAHTRRRRSYKADNDSPSRVGASSSSPLDDNKAMEREIENVDSLPMGRQESEETAANGNSSGEEQGKGLKKQIRHSFQKHRAPNEGSPPPAFGFLSWHDPEDYVHAKKKLKKAVLECYRGLEILENYRTLNVIGFRKALKKFEKTTKIPAQQAYFIEKIEPSAFSSGAATQSMLNEMERLYAARFTRGDVKVAKLRLRGDTQHKTHHFSTFRTGLLLGLAVPAFVDGIYRSFLPDTRHAIPAYGSLLYIYSIFFIPVIFALLVGVNILVWSRTRINYVFIFELDVKTRLDHREYFETPALLLSTLCYAFWLSFARIGSLTPIYWPLLWLLFAAAVMFDPMPILFRTSRWWLVRNVVKLLTSGAHRVEFADFWMGDQFCSLVYTLSNLYFVACAYSSSFDDSWERCTKPKPWGVPFILASLPFIARLVQSIKRWVDSRLGTHLINAGKYGAGIVYYLCYFIWRHDGGSRGASFIAWCIFGSIYAVYASAWDILMDWSLLRPHAIHPLLRTDVLYNNFIPLYYLAIITNILIRFIWVFYIPIHGPTFVLRTFIGAMLEMLRRVQWNFYRLENEHLGNMDQYRVTREVPLPYSFEDGGHDDDGDEDDRSSLSSWRKRKAKQSSPVPATTVLDDTNVDGLALRQSRD